MNRVSVAPLSSTLVRKIFSVYVSLACAMTLLQVGMAYRDGYSQVLRELSSIARQFEPGISAALWDYQESQIRSIAKGMMESEIVRSVDIHDTSMRINVSLSFKGAKAGDVGISKQVELFHAVTPESKSRLGTMTLYSSHGVVIGRIQFGLLLILASAAVKTIGLWLIIVYFANRLLAYPLRHFTEQIEKLDLSGESKEVGINLGTISGKELLFLRDAFNDMAGKVMENKRALEKFAAELADRVQERTMQLQKAQAELLETARHAGMAEIANNVLHNVGNVLNSVNTSVGAIGKTIQTSRLDGLSKATRLFDEHAADLASFLAQDDKGKMLPAYLKGVEHALKDEHRGMVEELARLVRNIEHLQEVIAMQQKYSGRATLKETVRINDLMDDALRIEADALAQAGVTVRCDYAAGLPALTLDKHRILLIVVNLLSNARQALQGTTEEAGEAGIVVRAAMGEAGRLRISVADRGHGIAPEHLTRIFAHGFTTQQDGRGFGLHSCAVAAMEMGGTLTVESEGAGRGACFTLEIPIQQD